MTAPLDLVLPRLDGVKRTGQDRFVARCPSHPDRHPSLAIRQLDDGTLLVHCFAGCDVAAVLGAVELETSDLFPQRSPGAQDARRPERRPFSASDLIHLAAWESLTASIVASDIANGKLADRQRLVTAALRLQHMAEVCGVRR